MYISPSGHTSFLSLSLCFSRRRIFPWPAFVTCSLSSQFLSWLLMTSEEPDICSNFSPSFCTEKLFFFILSLQAVSSLWMSPSFFISAESNVSSLTAALNFAFKLWTILLLRAPFIFFLWSGLYKAALSLTSIFGFFPPDSWLTLFVLVGLLNPFFTISIDIPISSFSRTLFPTTPLLVGSLAVDLDGILEPFWKDGSLSIPLIPFFFFLNEQKEISAPFFLFNGFLNKSLSCWEALFIFCPLSVFCFLEEPPFPLLVPSDFLERSDLIRNIVFVPIQTVFVTSNGSSEWSSSWDTSVFVVLQTHLVVVAINSLGFSSFFVWERRTSLKDAFNALLNSTSSLCSRPAPKNSWENV